MGELGIIYNRHSTFGIKADEDIIIVTDSYNEMIKSILSDVSADIVLVSHDYYAHPNFSIIKGSPVVIKWISQRK